MAASVLVTPAAQAIALGHFGMPFPSGSQGGPPEKESSSSPSIIIRAAAEAIILEV